MAKASAYSCQHRLWRHAGVGELMNSVINKALSFEDVLDESNYHLSTWQKLLDLHSPILFKSRFDNYRITILQYVYKLHVFGENVLVFGFG